MSKKFFATFLMAVMVAAAAISAIAANGNGDLTAKVSEMADGSFTLVVKYESGNNSIKAGFFEVLTPDGKTVLLKSGKVTFSSKSGMVSFELERDIPAGAQLRMTEDKSNKPVVVGGVFAEGFTFIVPHNCDIHGHKWVDASTPVSCTDWGWCVDACEIEGCDAWQYKTCEKDGCGATHIGRHDYTGHDMVPAPQWNADIVPTCTTGGVTYYECTICGQWGAEYPSATGHDYQISSKDCVAPTCEEEGSNVFVCSYCGDSYPVVVPEIGHDYVAGKTIPKTPWTDGYTIYACVHCGDWYKDDIDEAVPFDWQFVKTVEPTCTTWGYTVYEDEYWNVTKTANFVKPLGHNYVGVDTEPTCLDDGYTTFTCSRCGKWYEDDYVDAPGHAPGDEEIAVVPTCTEKGEWEIYCEVCNVLLESGEIDALGHDYDEGEVTEPTCTTRGFTTYTCQREGCDDSYKADFVRPNGHTKGPFEVTVEPTHTKSGVETCYCTVCNKVLRSRVIDALGHVTVELKEVSNSVPSYSGSGNTGRLGSTDVTLEFVLSDGSTVTQVVEFREVNVNNQGGKTNTEKTAVYEIGCYKVTVKITLATSGAGNSFTITTGTSAEIIDAVLIDGEDEE